MDEFKIQSVINLSQTELKVEKHVEGLKALSSGQLAASLGKAVNQYKVLKRQFTMLQTRLLLYETLEGGQCTGIQEIEDERKTTMEEIRGYQADIESSKSDIESLSEQLQHALSSYQMKKSTLQRRLQEVCEKKQKFESSVSNKVNFKVNSISHLSVVLERANHELKHLTNAEATWCEKLEALKHFQLELQETERATHQMVQDLEERKRHLVQNNRNLGDEVQAEQLALLHGIENIQFVENTLHIKFKPQAGGVGMQMSIQFVKEGEHRIKSVTIDPSSVDIEDLVCEAQQTNDLVYLVSAVSKRWQQSHRLIAEIEHLRHRFALDWRHSDRIVQVLYGEVVCSLQVQNNYPSPQSVCLLSVTGTDKNIQTVSPNTTTLTDWLEYMETQLQ